MKAKAIIITIIAVLIIVGIIVYMSSKPAIIKDYTEPQPNSAEVPNSEQNSFESTDDVFQEIDLALQSAE